MTERYHLIGIGGIGMSALAHVLLEKGKVVTGSDRQHSHLIDTLKEKGAEVFLGHSEEHLQGPSAVVFSTDIHEENPEMQAAFALKLPCMHRSQLLDHLMQDQKPLLVSGTHGKTTTSSLLAHVLKDLQLDPSYAIGGLVPSLVSHGGHGEGEYFVAEADESDGSFLNYTPFGAIVTNIDTDHLNYWQDMDRMVDGFDQFASSVQSNDHLFWCGDDERLRSLSLKGFSYGFDERNDLHLKNFVQEGWNSRFDFTFLSKEYLDVEVPLVGAHNVLNAASVMGMGLQLGISEKDLRDSLLTFRGVGRRAEFKGEMNGITIFDDYAHHPAEILATVRAMKQVAHGKRLVVVFQPHRYTRTKECFHEFAAAFQGVDLLIITSIYAASEEPIPGLSAESLAEEVKRTSKLSVCSCDRKEIAAFLHQELKENDLLVTMGAGDVTKVGPELLQGRS